MRKLPLVSLTALALAACTTAADTTTEAAPVVVATPVDVPYAPAIPAGTGIFAEASTLPFHAPDFTRIKDSDYQPAIEQGIAIQQAEVDAIAGNPAAPTFDNTIVPLEKSGQMLSRAYAVFSALTSANTNDGLDAIDTATAPKLAALRDSIVLNPKLFGRIIRSDGAASGVAVASATASGSLGSLACAAANHCPNRSSGAAAGIAS